LLPWSSGRAWHGLVEISDELLDFGTQGTFAGEIAAAKKLSREAGKPNLDLVEP
jgi:hypothetical protein